MRESKSGTENHVGRTQAPVIASADVEGFTPEPVEGNGFVRLCKGRVLVIVRPSIGLNTEGEQLVIHDVPMSEKCLQGTVVAKAPDVTEEIQLNDEVLFVRPTEGELPELAFMSADLIIARLEYPEYGAS
ncbi:MAG: hypothetical protein GY906_07820 [bacterium]|nr:hypothetical protein [bacterium]